MLYLAYMLNRIINLFYPTSCLVCSKKPDSFNKNICPDCLIKIEKRLPPFCMKCGRQLRGESGLQELCHDCRKDSIYYDRAFSALSYNGVLRRLMHDFKYNKMTALSEDFAELTIEFMKKYGAGKNIDLVLSIPMHRSRLFEREVNPSHFLARKIAKKLGIAYSKGPIKKIKDTPPQSRLKRHERTKNIKGSFYLKPGRISGMADKNILLVDDLFTTGSTVNEYSRLLKKAGARYIEVITVSRGDTYQ